MVHIRSTGGHCHRSLLPGLRCTDEPNVHLHHRREHHASSVSHQLSWDNRQQPSSVGSHHRYRRTARHCSNSISTIRQQFQLLPLLSPRALTDRGQRRPHLLVLSGDTRTSPTWLRSSRIPRETSTEASSTA